jgi:L-galactose dehydrogenase
MRGMKYRKLDGTSLRVSVLGFGGAPLGGIYGDYTEKEGIRAVHEALDKGINFFDVAPYYGLTRAETVLGKALKGVPREKYILCTKVGRYDKALFDFSAPWVTRSVSESLVRLGVSHLDILLVHDIEFGLLSQVRDETLPALQKVRQQGKFRYLGVSGLPLNIFPAILDHAPLDVVLSYCHHCLNDESLSGLLPYLRRKGVGVINAAPFGMGLLTQAGPPPWHPASAEIKAACAAAAELCRRKKSDLAHVALQFAVSNPGIATTLVGIGNRKQLEDNLKWFETPADPELFEEVRSILAPIHNQTWPSGRPENG